MILSVSASSVIKKEQQELKFGGKMKDLRRIIEILILSFFITCSYFYQGIKNRRFFSHLKNYIKEFFLHIEAFTKFIQEYKDFEDLQSSKQTRLKESSQGLHQLLEGKERFHYSLLILIDKPLPKYLKATLESALALTAPHFEVLVGFKGKQAAKIEKIVKDFKQRFPDQLNDLHFEDHEQQLTESFIINSLANQAKGNYLFLLNVGDWVRPDLLYRYEQTLNFYPGKDNIVLFCDEYQVDQNYTPIPRTRSHKPEQPVFPFVFNDVLGNTLLIPKGLWDKIGGLHSAGEKIHAFDLPLRLDEAGAIFHKVPVHLYAVMQSCKISRENTYASTEVSKGIIGIFERYSKNKKLNWHWECGYSKNSFRALPTLKSVPHVHVVMLYKNQRNMTLSAVKHVLNQTGVFVKITAVDNNSTDHSIAEKLEQMGVEVIRVNEAFNYSRLNNLAVRQTKIGNSWEYILFLNNDVDLEHTALLEMCRWIDQPNIGMVGCRLNYPNGLLQHGGVVIESSRAAFIKSWHHVERTEKFNRLEKTNFLRITPAVTAACCLIKRKTFLDVGGFNEMWYPVAFSDTALAVKVRAKGLHCLYTPFAVGIHHESISRKKVNIEDYESLAWAHRKFVQNLWNEEKIHFNDLANVDY